MAQTPNTFDPIREDGLEWMVDERCPKCDVPTVVYRNSKSKRRVVASSYPEGLGHHRCAPLASSAPAETADNYRFEDRRRCRYTRGAERCPLAGTMRPDGDGRTVCAVHDAVLDGQRATQTVHEWRDWIDGGARAWSYAREGGGDFPETMTQTARAEQTNRETLIREVITYMHEQGTPLGEAGQWVFNHCNSHFIQPGRSFEAWMNQLRREAGYVKER